MLFETFKPTYENVLVTPEMAKQLLRSQVKNRRVQQSRVDIYAKEMLAGRWTLNGSTIVIDKDGHMQDGQHRCLAIIKADKPEWLTIARGTSTDVFRTIDSGQSRRASQSFGIMGIKNASTTSAICSKVQEMRETHIYSDGGNSVKKYGTTDELIERFERDREGFEYAAELGQSMYRKLRIFTPTFIGTMYYYLTHDLNYPNLLVSNFIECLHTIGSTQIHQAGILRDLLIKRQLAKGSELRTRYVFNLFAKTWNKYVAGEKMKILTYAPEVEGDIMLMPFQHHHQRLFNY
jgi:hypothetical protein